jgi:hypothetical protein
MNDPVSFPRRFVPLYHTAGTISRTPMIPVPESKSFFVGSGARRYKFVPFHFASDYGRQKITNEYIQYIEPLWPRWHPPCSVVSKRDRRRTGILEHPNSKIPAERILKTMGGIYHEYGRHGVGSDLIGPGPGHDDSGLGLLLWRFGPA